jgi:hypothetical protein
MLGSDKEQSWENKGQSLSGAGRADGPRLWLHIPKEQIARLKIKVKIAFGSVFRVMMMVQMQSDRQTRR